MNSLPDSVLQLSEDNFYLSHPSLKSFLWNLLKSRRSRDQPTPGSFLWKFREDPGNEVVFSRLFHQPLPAFFTRIFFPLFAAIYFFPVPSLNFLRLFSSQIREKIGKHQEKKDEKDSIKTFSEVFRDIFQNYFDYFLSFFLFFSNCRSTVFGQFNEYFQTFSSIFRTFSQFSSFSPNSPCLFFSIFFSFF